MASLYDCVLTMSVLFAPVQLISFDLAQLTLAYDHAWFFFLCGVTA